MQVDLNDIKIPTEKLNIVVSENLEKVKEIHKKNRLRHIAGGCAAAAAGIAVLSGICLSNPVIAEKFTKLGEIFGLVQDQQRYPGDYSETSVPVPGTNVSQSEGITVTLSEFVCSSEALNVSVLIESEEPFPEPFIESVASADEMGNSFLILTTEQSTDFADGPLDLASYPYVEVQGSFQDEYTFAGAFRIDFNIYPYAQYEIPDSFTWDLKITKIFCPGGGGKVDRSLAIPGEWNFSSQITQQDIETKTVEVNQYAPNGSGITTVTVTPYELVVNSDYKEDKVQPGYERYDSMQSVILDGSGKLLMGGSGNVFPAAGYDLSKITVYCMDTPDEETWMAIQEKLYDESFAPQLQDYLESIAIQKIEIPL